MKRKSTIICVALLSLIAFSYQNCTGVSNPIAFTGEASTKADETDGNGGQPYDGKIYVTVGEPCADRSTIHSRIVLKNEAEGQLTRDNCQEIKPVALTANDFQLDPTDANRISFRGQAFGTEGLINLANFDSKQGYGIWIVQEYGTPADSRDNYTLSKLRLFENGIEMGPAHSRHIDIETIGLGRYSHWQDLDGGTAMTLFTSSDNSDPRTNGRKYTYVILP